MKHHTVWYYLHALIYFIVIPLLSIPFRLVAYGIPKDRALWIFGAHAGKSFDGNLEAFYAYAKSNRPNLRLVTIAYDPLLIERLKSEGHEVYTGYSLSGLWLTARASKAFIGNVVQEDLNLLTISPALTVYELWHGIPIKPIRWSHHPLLRKITDIATWLIPTPSLFIATYQQPVENTPEKMKITPEKIAVTGYPRNDILFAKKKSYAPLDAILADKDFKKIILYAPTYREERLDDQPFTAQGIKKINKLLKDQSALMLIKRHVVQKNIITPGASDRIIDISDAVGSIQPIYAYADIIISDYSSVVFDFSLLDRPCIFFAYDYESYTSARKMTIDYFQDLPGPFATSDEELIALLSDVDIWFNDSVYQDTYQGWIDKHNVYRDADSSARLMKLVESD